MRNKKTLGLATVAAVAGTGYLIKRARRSKGTFEKIVDSAADYMKSVKD